MADWPLEGRNGIKITADEGNGKAWVEQYLTDGTIIEATTLDSTAFGKLLKISGTTATYDVTLPSASGNSGKYIDLVGDTTANLTKAIRVIPASGTINGQNWLMIIAGRRVRIECDGTNWKICAQNEFRLEANLEIDISNAMTNAVINEWLAYAPKNLNEKELTFDFNNGTGTPKTYTISASLNLKNYHGGIININGDMGISGLSVSQGVYLDAGSNECNVFNVRDNYARIYIQGFKIRNKGDVNYNDCLITMNTQYLSIGYCYLLSTSKTKGIGMQIYYGSIADVWYNYFDNLLYGIHANVLSRAISGGNASYGTNPDYGLVAANNSVIGKYGGQITAGVAAETAENGSVIRS